MTVENALNNYYKFGRLVCDIARLNLIQYRFDKERMKSKKNLTRKYFVPSNGSLFPVKCTEN